MTVDLGFTGTQKGLTNPQSTVLVSTLTAAFVGGSEWLHHGDCIGGDAIAHAIWKELGGKVWLHPPTDDSRRAFCVGWDVSSEPGEYLLRNQQIVNACRLLVGCPSSMSETLRSGTWSTWRYAVKRHKAWLLILPDGSARIS